MIKVKKYYISLIILKILRILKTVKNLHFSVKESVVCYAMVLGFYKPCHHPPPTTMLNGELFL